MIEDFKILKLEDLVDSTSVQMIKLFANNLKIDESQWSVEKNYIISSGEPTDCFKKFCEENDKEELFKSFDNSKKLDYI